MELLSNIAKSLGFDSTLAIHLVCFAISYISLYGLVFKPYSRALAARKAKTHGQEEAASKMLNETQSMQSEYEQKARALNQKISEVYETSKRSVAQDYDRVVEAAKAKTTTQLESAREKIAKESRSAREALTKDISSVGAAIATKLSGKEIST
jgi:F0F1-type ATP synthase membrane subunit b/b'